MSDYVTKDAVQRVITNSAAKLYITGQISKEESPKLVAYVLSAVEKMPGTVIKQKWAKWLMQDDGDSLFYRCSSCMKAQSGNFTEIWLGYYHFCPNCGATMVDPDFCEDCPYDKCSIPEIGSCDVVTKDDDS